MAVPQVDEETSQGDGRSLPRIVSPVGEAELRELGRDLPAIAVGRANAIDPGEPVEQNGFRAGIMAQEEKFRQAQEGPVLAQAAADFRIGRAVHPALDDPPGVLEFGPAQRPAPVHPDQVDPPLEKIRPRPGPAPHGEGLIVVQTAGPGRRTSSQGPVHAESELSVPVTGHGQVVVSGGIQDKPGAGCKNRSAAGVRHDDLHRPPGAQAHLKARSPRGHLTEKTRPVGQGPGFEDHLEGEILRPQVQVGVI